MKKYISLLAIIIITVSCSTPLNFQVSKIGEEPEEYTQRIIYSLPATVVRINIEIEKETYIPGPYEKFADRFLGLDQVIQDYSFQYKIGSVDVQTFSEPDPSMFYSLNVIEGSLNWEKYLSLSNQGFVLQTGESGIQSLIVPNSKGPLLETSFNELSMKMNLTEITDTLYKTIVTDTMLIRLPVLTTAQKVRTLEQKAKEAASNLFILRENRFYTITNVDGDYPDGKAMDIMVGEMDKMEKAYLELFMGKVVRQKFTRSFLYSPTSSEELQVHKLCSFSPQKGLTESENAYDIVIELTPLNNIPEISLNKTSDSEENMNNNKLYYRIPDIADLKVKLVGDVLYENRIGIYQLGSLLAIPVN